MVDNGTYDKYFVDKHVEGFREFKEYLIENMDFEFVAKETGLSDFNDREAVLFSKISLTGMNN